MPAVPIAGAAEATKDLRNPEPVRCVARAAPRKGRLVQGRSESVTAAIAQAGSSAAQETEHVVDDAAWMLRDQVSWNIRPNLAASQGLRPRALIPPASAGARRADQTRP